MILLDTDHVSVLRMPTSARRTRLVACLALALGEEIAIPVAVTEETMRGWLSALAKERQPRRQVFAYRELADLFRFFVGFPITPFDDAAVTIFEGFGRIRIGAMDKKIAAIAIANNALLLTANRKDFEQIPGLRFENWMDEPPAAPSSP
jgi:tRNA(fMet)-specific endonuclease VapC